VMSGLPDWSPGVAASSGDALTDALSRLAAVLADSPDLFGHRRESMRLSTCGRPR
jgi:hypothetical protein